MSVSKRMKTLKKKERDFGSRRLAKVEVVGSSPITRSKTKSNKIRKSLRITVKTGDFEAIPACVWIAGLPYFFLKITEDSSARREIAVGSQRAKRRST